MPAVWKATTAYVADDVVVPSTRNGHLYRPSKAGTSGAAEPAWPLAVGDTVKDGTVTWKEAGYSWPVAWRPSLQYQSGAIVLPVVRNGHKYRATGAGTSGATEPAWPLVAGATVADGGITWKEAGDPELNVRPDQSRLTKVEKARYVAAVKRLKTDGVWDIYVQHHQELMPSGGMMASFGHVGPAFFPWHRYFQFQLEVDLQHADNLLGNDGDLTTPFWDWVLDQSEDPLVNGLWDNAFMGDSRVAGPVPGAFAGANWPITVGSPPDAPVLERALHDSTPTLPEARTVTAAHNVTTYDVSPWSMTSAAASSYRNFAEGWRVVSAVPPHLLPALHNRVHDYVGRHLGNFETSPNDPLFFLHHANVDRLWVRWQESHSGVDQYPARLPAGTSSLTAVVVPLGGTLAAGAYTYQVAAVVPAGHTRRSNEVTAIVAANGRINLSWTAVTGATQYLIYRRSLTEGYRLYRLVGAVTSFADTGAAGPAPVFPPRPATQPRLGHAFDDPMIPWDGRPDPRPAPYDAGRYPVIRPRDMLRHTRFGYRYARQPLIRVIAKAP